MLQVINMKTPPNVLSEKQTLQSLRELLETTKGQATTAAAYAGDPTAPLYLFEGGEQFKRTLLENRDYEISLLIYYYEGCDGEDVCLNLDNGASFSFRSLQVAFDLEGNFYDPLVRRPNSFQLDDLTKEEIELLKSQTNLLSIRKEQLVLAAKLSQNLYKLRLIRDNVSNVLSTMDKFVSP